MAARLKNIVIENFRSLRGQVVIPLDAQVVLIHGSNGMGKTSVLSALELALTGKIAHLAAEGDRYRSYLTTLGSTGGRVELTTSAAPVSGGHAVGSLSFGDDRFEPSPLLDPEDARFFAERCYLPQATLGRLLEIYDDQKTNTTSPLTRFVKELLGLDPLDALVDGLYPAGHVSRVRNLVPEYRRLERLHSSLTDEVARGEQSIAAALENAETRRKRINALLAQIEPTAPFVIESSTDLESLRSRLEADRTREEPLAALGRISAELRAITQSWRSSPRGSATRERAEKERLEHISVEAVAAWRSESGAQLQGLLTGLRDAFPDLPSMDNDPEAARVSAEKRAEAEAARCETLIEKGKASTERLGVLQLAIQRSTARVAELNDALSAATLDVKSLAGALAGIASHVSGETCPVCDRNYAETGAGSLTTHIAAKIASLTSEAGRLQSLATERATESNRLSIAQRDVLSAQQDQLSPIDLAYLTVRAARMATTAQQLKALAPQAMRGTVLLANSAAAREAVATARRQHEQDASILPEADRLVTLTTQRQLNTFKSVEVALTEAQQKVAEDIQNIERRVALRTQVASELASYSIELASIQESRTATKAVAEKLASVEEAKEAVDTCRERAKKVAETADRVRSGIVKSVFNTSLNKVWRDLFVRLAPSEQFVPTFKLPIGDRGNVEAVLETVHRSGRTSGSPGAMLSQGNLNTAALTLFLALHLSVPPRIPWLVLDDPVQSMDDVHIAQFAALLRTLSKGMDRQLVVAVHERALFDYLTLELSPAFPGDSLISVEITRNFSGEAVATPKAFSYENDRAIAA